MYRHASFCRTGGSYMFFLGNRHTMSLYNLNEYYNGDNSIGTVEVLVDRGLQSM